MDAETRVHPETGAAALVGGILEDAKDLLGQQVEMFRSEVKQELRQLRHGIVSVCIGAGIAVLGALFILTMVAHLLAAKTEIPLWGCYGIVGGGLAVIGLIMLAAGRKSVSDVHLARPPVATRALKENVEWLKSLKQRKTVEPTN